MALGARYAPGRRGRRLRNTVNELLGDQAEGRCPGLPEPCRINWDGNYSGELRGVTQQRPHRSAALGQIAEVCQLLPGRIRTVEIAATRGREAVGFGQLGQIFWNVVGLPAADDLHWLTPGVGEVRN